MTSTSLARLAPVVDRVLWALLGPDPDREDLAQDIFLRIFHGASSVRDPACLEKWAARVVANSVKNEFRRRSLRRWLSLEPYEEASELEYHPDFEGREQVVRLQRVLEQMPAGERTLLSLSLLGGTSLAELAQHCECSARTVRRRLKAARQRFARLARHDPILAGRMRPPGTR